MAQRNGHSILGIILVVAVGMLVSCGSGQDRALLKDVPPADDISGDFNGVLKSDQLPGRMHLTTVSMILTKDTIQLDGAVNKTEDGGRCVFIKPQNDDDNYFRTVLAIWHPMQVYWAIRGRESDVERTSLPDTYFAGDVIGCQDLPAVDGSPVLGIMALREEEDIGQLNFSDLQLQDDGATIFIDTDKPMNAYLKAHAEVDSAGGCRTHMTYCKKTGDCSDEASYKPFTSIHLKMSILGSVIVKFL